MAYMSQEKKKKLAPAIKRKLAMAGLKGSLAVRSHMTLVLNIQSGRLDFVKNFVESAPSMERSNQSFVMEKKHIGVNTYHIDKQFSGECQRVLMQLKDLMNVGNHDRSDIMTDYFDVGWYIDINIGKWNKPYEVTR